MKLFAFDVSLNSTAPEHWKFCWNIQWDLVTDGSYCSFGSKFELIHAISRFQIHAKTRYNVEEIAVESNRRYGAWLSDEFQKPRRTTLQFEPTKYARRSINIWLIAEPQWHDSFFGSVWIPMQWNQREKKNPISLCIAANGYEQFSEKLMEILCDNIFVVIAAAFAYVTTNER